ncbi:MAG: TlpA family protein disulfide reductase [Fimbriimonadales bacterium]|jgi:thiol-disulfide isomerase/thioredoxin|nr:TlpA family protein disulfide reductase [Armatimonadota bacterium]MCX7688444.1 TlpA family protein disulfide reductase [Fimbriimonadales bacterium]CUU10347.1 AhpC/TSA family protein [Armatimonadetes bacterium GBS]CUU33890.1 AhpC/TSA family protein [Armatimonadetes bacterium DC]CUU37307.1 AhpC/TSA family protein [Armatimonadetes bacterium GXS]GBC91183.1 Thiol-disulfide oxidoreductase ResA [bacterium HR14]
MWTRILVFGLLLTLSAGVIAEPKIPRTNYKDLQSRLQKLKGKVVVVNFWATWCGPCMEEMPDLARFYKNYRSKGVEMIGVSVDDPELADSAIPPVLRKHGVTYRVVVLDEDPNTFIEKFDKNWQGEVPRFYLYSKSGKRLAAWSGKTPYAELEKRVKEALKAK